MPAVLVNRRRKAAVVLSVAAGALGIGSVGSAQAAPIPCEWYDCVPIEIEKKWPPIPPECRCPDIYLSYFDQAVLPQLQADRFKLSSQLAPVVELDAQQLAGLQP